MDDRASKELLFSVTIKDCDVQEFCASGPGGQHRNRTYTAIRIIHRASGAVGVSSEHKSQLANKRAAFERMANSPKFKAWHRMETARRLGQPTIESVVDKAMQPQNLRVEVRDEKGQWQTDGR